MTPAEHYAEAERLAEAAKADVRDANQDAAQAWGRAVDRALVALAAAKVHAELANVTAAYRPPPGPTIYPTATPPYRVIP